MNLRSCGKTHIGKVRKNNEDSILIHESLRLFGVADGMGGHHAGEVASHTAVETVARLVGEATAGRSRRDVLRRAATQAHREVVHKSEESTDLSGMGTTLSVILFDDSRGYIAHVGDSRIYRVRNALSEQLTLDHSYVAEQIRSGNMTPDEAEKFGRQNILTRALGTQDQAELDFYETDLCPGDRFLICSDGLWGMVKPDELNTTLLDKKRSQEELVDQLIELALAGGGNDNISVVMVDIDDIDSETVPISDTQPLLKSRMGVWFFLFGILLLLGIGWWFFFIISGRF